MERKRIPNKAIWQNPLRKKEADVKGVKKRPVGRPPEYREYYAVLVYKLRLLGMSLDRIAALFDIRPLALEEWRKTIPEFAKAWDDGSDYADANVAAALYHRAVGYEHEAEKIFYNAREDRVRRVRYVEHYAPEVSAATAWLNNRKPEFWKNKVVEEHVGIGNTTLPPPVIIVQPVMPAPREYLESRVIDE